jgi:hypothetical protein
MGLNQIIPIDFTQGMDRIDAISAIVNIAKTTLTSDDWSSLTNLSKYLRIMQLNINRGGENNVCVSYLSLVDKMEEEHKEEFIKIVEDVNYIDPRSFLEMRKDQFISREELGILPHQYIGEISYGLESTYFVYTRYRSSAGVICGKYVEDPFFADKKPRELIADFVVWWGRYGPLCIKTGIMYWVASRNELFTENIKTLKKTVELYDEMSKKELMDIIRNEIYTEYQTALSKGLPSTFMGYGYSQLLMFVQSFEV